jgi:hypothetical protein
MRRAEKTKAAETAWGLVKAQRRLSKQEIGKIALVSNRIIGTMWAAVHWPVFSEGSS